VRRGPFGWKDLIAESTSDGWRAEWPFRLAAGGSGRVGRRIEFSPGFPVRPATAFVTKGRRRRHFVHLML